jgi:hypothetical protein
MAGLLDAAADGNIARMQRLLAGGADITEVNHVGQGVLIYAARSGKYTAMGWLLVEAGASISEVVVDNYRDVPVYWNMLRTYITGKNWPYRAEFSSLLKIMVMLEDAPAYFIRKLSPEHATICTRGKKLRAQLPTYLEQQRARIVTYCPLPDVLHSLVITYAATTPEDMWTYGLCYEAPQAKRA